jgi:hypothetical protein
MFGERGPDTTSLRPPENARCRKTAVTQNCHDAKTTVTQEMRHDRHGIKISARPLPPPPGCTTYAHCSSVSGCEIARHPPAPRTRHGGGGCSSPENLPGPHIKRQKAMRCDSVAMRAVSTRCQLKSLRDERWRRPLKPREGQQKNGPTNPVQSYGCLRSSRVGVPRVFST